MADFCQQCSMEVWGEDFQDLAGVTSPEDEDVGFYAVVVCEGCGVIRVDSAGRCVSPDCGLSHGAPQ